VVPTGSCWARKGLKLEGQDLLQIETETLMERGEQAAYIRGHLHAFTYRGKMILIWFFAGGLPQDMERVNHWLGHASINPTNRYAKGNLEMKRGANLSHRPLQILFFIAVYRCPSLADLVLSFGKYSRSAPALFESAETIRNA
jgi:hypothetical protein